MPVRALNVKPSFKDGVSHPIFSMNETEFLQEITKKVISVLYSKERAVEEGYSRWVSIHHAPGEKLSIADVLNFIRPEDRKLAARIIKLALPKYTIHTSFEVKCMQPTEHEFAANLEALEELIRSKKKPYLLRRLKESVKVLSRDAQSDIG